MIDADNLHEGGRASLERVCPLKGEKLMSVSTMQSLQFIRAAGVAGLVSGIETGMIGARETMTAFSAVGEALDRYAQVVDSSRGMADLRSSIDAFRASPPRVRRESRRVILTQFMIHRDVLECAIRLPAMASAAMASAAAAIAHDMPASAPMPTTTSAVDAVANVLITAPYDFGSVWRWIPAGTFPMGSAADDRHAAHDEEPLRTVMVGGFYMLDHPVTEGEFSAFLADTGKKDPRAPGHWTYKRPPAGYPATYVSYDMASAYAAWYGAQLAARTGHAVVGRIPTEAEWEKAAKGPNGDEFIEPATHRQAHFGAMAMRAVKDPRAYANGYGLTDMIGNVWEWTSSPIHEGSPCLVMRGGAYTAVSPAILRAAHRSHGVRPQSSGEDIGFRIVLVPQDSGK